jgi:hypothetical protein
MTYERRKFKDALLAYLSADDRARKTWPKRIDILPFQEVFVDLDAAIPGLSRLSRDKALVLKASCLY